MRVPPSFIVHSLRELARIARRSVVIARLDPAWDLRSALRLDRDHHGICAEAARA